MEDEIRKDIPLDSPISMRTENEMINVNAPELAYNNQKLQNGALANSFSFVHKGHAAGNTVYDVEDYGNNEVRLDHVSGTNQGVYAKATFDENTGVYRVVITDNSYTDDGQEPHVIGTMLVSLKEQLTNQNYNINDVNISRENEDNDNAAVVITGTFNEHAFSFKQYLQWVTDGAEASKPNRTFISNDAGVLESECYESSDDSGVTTLVIKDTTTYQCISFQFTPGSALYNKSIFTSGSAKPGDDNFYDYRISEYTGSSAPSYIGITNARVHTWSFGYFNVVYTENGTGSYNFLSIKNNAGNVSDEAVVHGVAAYDGFAQFTTKQKDELDISVTSLSNGIENKVFAVGNVEATKKGDTVVNAENKQYITTEFDLPGFSADKRQNYFINSNNKQSINTRFKIWSAAKVHNGKVDVVKSTSNLLWLASGVAEHTDEFSGMSFLRDDCQIDSNTLVAYDIYLNAAGLQGILGMHRDMGRNELCFHNDRDTYAGATVYNPERIIQYDGPLNNLGDPKELKDFTKNNGRYDRLHSSPTNNVKFYDAGNNSWYLDEMLLVKLAELLDYNTCMCSNDTTGDYHKTDSSIEYRYSMLSDDLPWWVYSIIANMDYTRDLYDAADSSFQIFQRDNCQLFQGDWGNGTRIKNAGDGYNYTDNPVVAVKDPASIIGYNKNGTAFITSFNNLPSTDKTTRAFVSGQPIYANSYDRAAPDVITNTAAIQDSPIPNANSFKTTAFDLYSDAYEGNRRMPLNFPTVFFTCCLTNYKAAYEFGNCGTPAQQQINVAMPAQASSGIMSRAFAVNPTVWSQAMVRLAEALKENGIYFDKYAFCSIKAEEQTVTEGGDTYTQTIGWTRNYYKKAFAAIADNIFVRIRDVSTNNPDISNGYRHLIPLNKISMFPNWLTLQSISPLYAVYQHTDWDSTLLKSAPTAHNFNICCPELAKAFGFTVDTPTGDEK